VWLIGPLRFSWRAAILLAIPGVTVMAAWAGTKPRALAVAGVIALLFPLAAIEGAIKESEPRYRRAVLARRAEVFFRRLAPAGPGAGMNALQTLANKAGLRLRSSTLGTENFMIFERDDAAIARFEQALAPYLGEGRIETERFTDAQGHDLTRVRILFDRP
jgi:hypothetical protein